ncbi:ygp1p [Saccharomyces arboricola H-6]|uniref:Ygp1p n=1 Tax=Saccharomyces arboricola (strain H-6 / AS 2.3317 / CBS 10644) TaxID=1160507 RepID=J8PZZ6_SACAR|nr:ygp1p [Saccharomyces arboricola H-6]
MKLQVVLSALLACSSAVVASPIENLFKYRAAKVSHSKTINSTLPTWSSSNGSNTTYANSTNSTTNTTSSEKSQLQIIVTGGEVPITNSSLTHTNYTRLYNSSSALNITELYNVARVVNETIQEESSSGAVVVTNAKSLEAVAFFFSIVFDTNKPIIITEDSAYAIPVANDKKAASRGVLSVTSDKLVYSGVFTPASACSYGAGLPVAIVDDQDQVEWFFDASKPTLISSSSVIRKEYSNFTTPYGILQNGIPVVPIVYDGGYSTSLISSLSSVVQGLVVVSSGSTNSTSSTIESTKIPVVYAEANTPLNFIDAKDVPKNAIGAGYLSPIKAQILLSIAAVNGVTSKSALENIFP